jgi:hypothetical protein
MNMPAPSCDPVFCSVLKPALERAGFNSELTHALALNEPLLRATLVRAAVGLKADPALVAQDDPQEAGTAMFGGDFVPLPLQPSEWRSFFDECAAAGLSRPCLFEGGDDCFANPVFEQAVPQGVSKLLLVETLNGRRSLQTLEAIAGPCLPGCLERTRPRQIFDLVRYLSGTMSEINAAYVLLADPQRGADDPIPIIINPPKGALRLGFVKGIPSNSGYSGYSAYVV